MARELQNRRAMPIYRWSQFLIGILALLAGFILTPAHSESKHEPQVIRGKVVAIADGDTLTVLVDRRQVKIRLHGIDCPERGQPFSRRAKALAGELAFGNTVDVEVKDVDRYGRTVGVVILPDGRVLNQELVGAGLAWWYQRYAPKDATLERLEAEARTARRGLWSDPKALPPWEWRKR